MSRHLGWIGAVVLATSIAACATDESPSPASLDPAATVSASEPAATESAAGSGGTPKVYVIGAQSNSTFWQTIEAGVNQAGEDLPVDIVFARPETSSATDMVPAIRAAIAAEPAAIALPYFDKAIEAPVVEALDRNIPVVLYNNNRFEAKGGDSSTATTNPRVTGLPYVGQDERVSGEILAAAFTQYLPAGAKVLIVNPVPGAQVLTLRTEGVKRGLEAAGMTVDYLDAVIDETQNIATIGAYLDAHPEIQGVVGLGTPTANPAATVIAQRGLGIPVATFDIDSGALKHVREGNIQVALNQQPWLQGYGAVWNAYLKTVLGLNPVNIDTGTSIVTRDNVEVVAGAIEAGRN